MISRQTNRGQQKQKHFHHSSICRLSRHWIRKLPILVQSAVSFSFHTFREKTKLDTQCPYPLTWPSHRKSVAQNKCKIVWILISQEGGHFFTLSSTTRLSHKFMPFSIGNCQTELLSQSTFSLQPLHNKSFIIWHSYSLKDRLWTTHFLWLLVCMVTR